MAKAMGYGLLATLPAGSLAIVAGYAKPGQVTLYAFFYDREGRRQGHFRSLRADEVLPAEPGIRNVLLETGEVTEGVVE